jgi:ferredoxin
LTASDLVDLVLDADAPVVLCDRGWCAECPAGGEAAPWSTALEEAKTTLSFIAPDKAGMVAAVQKPSPPESDAHGALRPDRQVDRRTLLRRIAGVETPRTSAAESRRVVFGRGAVVPLKRRRTLEQARRSGDGIVPAALMPAIEVADGCELHGLCAAVCPTQAISRFDAADAAGLTFDAETCIECGECERVCPTKALSLWRGGGGPQGGRELVRRATIDCGSCGAPFVATGGAQLCPACRKTVDLMREVGALRFGRARIPQDAIARHEPRNQEDGPEGGPR